MYERKLNLLTFLLKNDYIFTIILCLCFSFTFGMANEKLNGLEKTIELL